MTTKASHTPGPWTCCAKKYKGLSAGIVRDRFNDPVADCRYSEVPSRDKKTPEVIDANARLIAAAPAMLDALQKAQTAMQNNDPVFYGNVLDTIRAALALYEKETP